MVFILEFLIVFQFFVSVSDKVFNILRNSPLDLLVGQCPTISIIGGARAPAAPAESTPMDTLLWKVNALAFIEDFPVLPNDVSRLDDTIKCLKIEPYRDYPGFVRLRVFGKLNYNWKCKKYAFSYSILPNEYIRFDLDALQCFVVT